MAKSIILLLSVCAKFLLIVLTPKTVREQNQISFVPLKDKCKTQPIYTCILGVCKVGLKNPSQALLMFPGKIPQYIPH